MIRERTRRALLPIAVCAALLGGLLVLTANLGDIGLDPGSSVPPLDPSDGSDASGHPLSFDIPWLRTALFAAFTVSLAIVLLSAVLARTLRRWLYFTIGLFGALLVFDFFADRIPSTSSHGTDGTTIERIAVAQAEHAPTDWNRVLVALGLSLATAAVIAAGSTCAIRWWRAARVRRRDAELAESLEDLAERTFSAGRSADIVLRCYREMLDLLSRREQIPHEVLTAREFADRLRSLGLPTAAVDRLTDLFERVRYGHRDGRPLEGRAVADLEAIRRGNGATQAAERS